MEEKKLPDDFWTNPVDIDPFAQCPEAGADLEAIADHQTELGGIVEQMWNDMVNETKILEGTEIAEREEIVIPPITEEEFRALMLTFEQLEKVPSVEKNEN
jgi:hypothetical protein